MAPSVEQLQIRVGPEDGQVFAVDLDNPAPFDPELFKRLSAEIHGIPSSEGVDFKYVVRGNRMFVFSFTLQHSVVNYILGQLNAEEELSSAGEIRMTRGSEGPMGEISGFSSSLSLVLPRGKSYDFRDRIMKPLLEPYFTFM